MTYTSIICSLDSLALTTVLSGVGFFLGVTLLLVVILLIAKKYLVQSGEVTITMNGDTHVKALSGKSLLSTMADSDVFLPSACGGKGSCGQCRLQVEQGGGEACLPRLCILPAKSSRKAGVSLVRLRLKAIWI